MSKFLSSRAKRLKWLGYCSGLLAVSACAGNEAEPVAIDGPLTFEEFRDSLPYDSTNGFYVVEGDIPVYGDEELLDYYYEMTSHALIAERSATADDKYDDIEKYDLSYCISNAFTAEQKAQLVTSMSTASKEWMEATKIKSTDSAAITLWYKSGEDVRCDGTDAATSFRVVPSPSTATYDAAAFYPSWLPEKRNLFVHTRAFRPAGSFPTLTGVLRHELGHLLGFRHEHARSPLVTCSEETDTTLRPFGPYDPRSVMHYIDLVQHADGSCYSSRDIRDYNLTQYDKSGVRCYYNKNVDACKGNNISAAARVFGTHKNGTIYRILSDNGKIEKYTADPVGTPERWVSVSANSAADPVADISALYGVGSRLYRVKKTGNLLQWWKPPAPPAVGAWTGTDPAGKQLVLAHVTGDLYRLNDDNTISRLNASTLAWTTVLSTNVAGRTLYAGSKGVLRKDPDGKTYRYTSASAAWVQIAGTGRPFMEVVEDQAGKVYGRTSAGNVFEWDGAGATDADWKDLGAGFEAIYGGLDVLMAKNAFDAKPTFYRTANAWVKYALNTSKMFGAGKRRLAQETGTSKLYDYLFP